MKRTEHKRRKFSIEVNTLLTLDQTDADVRIITILTFFPQQQLSASAATFELIISKGRTLFGHWVLV